VQEVEVITYSHRRLRELPAKVPVQDIMKRELHTVLPETPLADAVQLLLDKVYRTLLVVDGTGRLVGILTDGDLLNRAELLPPSVQRGLTQAELARELQRLRRTGQTVGENMTPDPVTITAETPIPAVVKLMIERDVKRLPVVDEDNRLLGIVSRVDVLRALSQPAVAESPRQNPPPGHHLQVDEIMMTNVPTVHVDASLAEVVELLVTSVQRRVIVIDDEHRVVGIITDGDLIKRALPTERNGIIQSLSRQLPLAQDDSFHLSRRAVAEVMTKPVITVTPETPLAEALQLLLTHHIKRLPVVNTTGQLVGLVGRGGILQVMAANTGS
jgi:CBS domain-containing protein